MQELKQILLKAKKQVFSNLTGENLTRLKGDGMDLRDIKSYEFGDDIRRINWNASAKSSEIQVNTYDEYKQLNISLIYLSSPTMLFGSLRFKKDIVSEIFAYLLYSSVKNHDFCKSVIFDKKPQIEIKPPKKIAQIDSIVKTIYEYEPRFDIDYDALTKYINKTYKKSHIIILVGDFLTKPNLSLINKKHQLYSIMVRDDLEEELKFSGDISLKDFLTSKDYDFNINSQIKRRYKKLITSHDNSLEKEFIKNKIDFKKIKTSHEVYINLRELFK